MTQFLDALSQASTLIIAILGAIHLVFFLILWVSYRRNLLVLASTLDDFTRGFKHRSVLDRGTHWSDQIEAFLTDIQEVLELPNRSEEREELRKRMHILDEKRRYLQSMGFEVASNVCRNMIEAYPLLGILGTILAIGLAVQAGSNASVQLIVERFGQAIWSTCAGLVAAVILMLINSFVEPAFERLIENRHHVAQTVARVKRALAIG